MVEELAKEFVSGLNEKLIKYCNNRVFTEASVGVYTPLFSAGYIFSLNCHNTCLVNEKKPDEHLFFDLASLTKPLVTLLSILVLLEEKKISWEEPLDSLLEIKIKSPLKYNTIQNLLCHNSGLPAHVEFWRKLKDIPEKERKKKVMEAILSEKVIKIGNKKHIYSDLGYILLGFIIEKKSRMVLDFFWQEKVARPLGIEKTLNFPKNLKNPQYVKTGKCPWSKITLEGIVHDDNSRVLGGVCGHAGLFGTTESVLFLCQEMLNILKGKGSVLTISEDTFNYVCQRVGDSEWTTGFNLPTAGVSSSGTLFSPESIGHLGYTGTSFWIDPVEELIVVLLTNRVIMGNDRRGIQKLRPDIHDYVVKETKKKCCS